MSALRRLTAAGLLTGLALGLPSSLEAQVSVPDDWSLELGGRVQSQLAHSSVDGAPGTDLFLRRVRLKLDLTLNEWFSGRIQHDFASGSLKDAYVKLSTGDAFGLSFGQFKRAFDLFELSSSTELSVIERDGRVPGVDACAGPGGTCSLSRLSEKLDYSGRDLGVRLEGSAGERVDLVATVTNGPGANQPDANGAKSAAGRVVVALADGVRLAGNVSLRDYVTDAGDADYGAAWGADLEIGDFRADGLHLQAGVIVGDNWQVLDPDGEAASFTALQGILSWYRPVSGGGPFVAVEPLARASWADPDTGADDDAGLLLTPGLMAYVGGRNKIGANVDVYSPQAGGTEWSLKVQAFLHF